MENQDIPSPRPSPQGERNPRPRLLAADFGKAFPRQLEKFPSLTARVTQTSVHSEGEILVAVPSCVKHAPYLDTGVTCGRGGISPLDRGHGKKQELLDSLE